MQEVIGSIPFTSTNDCREEFSEMVFFGRPCVKTRVRHGKFQGFDPIV
jgi:hypothetical protein